MTVLADVAALVARYDDDAWVALANRGLLRRARKDLESTSPSVAADDDDGGGDGDGDGDAVVVVLGERTVRFPRSGPAEATCDCPSPVICQHVLAAGLWLATQAGPSVDVVETVGAGEAVGAAPVDPGETLHDELMTLDTAALAAHAGRPGLRWAHQLVADAFAGDAPPRVTRGGYLTVAFGQPEVVARYPGGGLDGLVLDQVVTHPARWRVAAVLAWQRAHGAVLEPPPVATRATAPTERGMSRDDSRARLLTTVGALLEDLVRVGVSHLSPATLDRLTTAATWAQGADYPRLALLLRRLADQVDLALGRDASADDHRLLDEVALAYGLVTALVAAAARGEEPAHLVGRSRTSYDAIRSLDLVGLGGQPWRTSSGYHGLTCVFFSPERRRFFTWGDARPEDVAGFDPRARWAQPAAWKGLASPATTSGRRLVLTGAQVSADGRLSGAESTSALVTPTDSDDLLGVLPAVASWADLGQSGGSAGSGPRSLLAVADRSAAWAVLRPAAVGEAVFDAARQTLVWPLLDAAGEVVALELPWSRLHAHAIARVEAVGSLPGEALVVARLRRHRGAWVGDPVSVVLPGRELNPVDALHFDGEVRSSLVGRLLDSGTPDRAVDDQPDDQVNAATPSGSLPVSLLALRALVERQAQRGVAGTPPGAVHDRVASAHRALRAVGWSVFVDPDPAVDAAALLLRSHYLLQQVERTFG